MKISEFKTHLHDLSSLNFVQPDGTFVPRHFHITEAGLTTKHFIDCGGTIRTDKVINFQVWSSSDTDHRLQPDKLIQIIATYEKHFGTDDLDIEVEYQTDTIGRYGIALIGHHFLLTAKLTDCLASDHCGIPEGKEKLNMVELNTSSTSSCTPGSGCC